MDEWREEPLEDCLDELIDYRGKSPKKSTVGIPVLSAKVVKTTGLLEPIKQTISEEYYSEWMTRGIPQAGDVIFTTEAPMGEVIQLDERTAKFALGQRIVCLRADPRKLDNTFLRYALTAPAQQNLLTSYATGTTVSGISQKALRSVPLRYPELDEQKAIANVLSALDKKIELNRRTNETLKAIARAIFKDWFVDFGPVRRIQAGETDAYAILGGLVPAGQTAIQTAALFPESVGKNGLPDGWETTSVGEALSDTIGGDWGTAAPDLKHTEKVAIIRGTDFPKLHDGDVGNIPIRYTTKKKLDRRRLRHGDILIEVSGGSPTSPTGRSVYIDNNILDKFHSDVVCASFCRRFRPRNEVKGLILAQHLERLYRIGGTWEYQNQSTGIANFQTTYFLDAEEIVTASDEVETAFAALIRPLLQKTTSDQNRKLAQTRDFLLPKLMSGQIRAIDAESMVA